MSSWRPVLRLVMLALSMGLSVGEPLNFDPFFGEETSFFSPQENTGPFESFSGYSFNPAGGVRGIQLTPNFQTQYASETSDIPVYTDGKATPPQITLSQLEKDYKTTLHRLANTRTTTGNRPRHRYPKFVSEPFPSASNVDERNPTSSSGGKTKAASEGPRFVLPKSQPIEIHTGFVPIIKGSTQNYRNNQDISSTVIKDIEPPILTAAPGSLTARPNLLKVSASLLSSTKTSPSNNQYINSSSSPSSGAPRPRSRQANFGRFLSFPNDTRTVSVSSSSSESIVSRGASRPESILDLQQKELFRVAPSSESVVFEENKLSARKLPRHLEINCEGSHDLGWCELGDKYPKKYVNEILSSCEEIIERMHVEVPHSFEKLSDTSDFKAELDNSSRRSAKERGSHDAWSWAAYFHQGALCDAETGFLRPETAKDSTGRWNIIVQTDNIRQRIPIEMCRKTNGSCKKMPNCGLKSQCLQKYNYHLLLSLNPAQKHDCPFMKLYRFPSACVCHVE